MAVQYSQPTALPRQDTPAPRQLRYGVGLILMASLAAVFIGLAQTGQAPWGDAGGYENMLRHFLQTGEVDYMHWSQPTFLGVLALAAPWSRAFGTATASLQGVGVTYGILLVVGLYVFLTRYTRPVPAALLCLSLLCFTEFLSSVPTFMTDVPYAAYLVWFVVVHQWLERRSLETPPARFPLAGWAAWAALFLLTCLTRSFTLVLVPVFLALSLLQRGHGRQFARLCLGVSVVASVLCLLIIRRVTVHGFSLLELTVLPDLLLRHQWARFELRTLGTSLLQAALTALPILVLSRQARLTRPRPAEAAAAAIGLLLAFYFWHKGLLPALFTLPGLPRSAAAIALLQVALAPVAFLLLSRVLPAACRGTDGTMWVLLALVVAHFAVLPIMQHPLLRHVFPAFLALIMIVAIVGVQPGRRRLLGAAAAILLIGGCNLLAVRQARLVNAAEYRLSERLLQSGIPTSDIDGGWSWFCAQDLHPGHPEAPSYVTRYHDLERKARYTVTPEPDAPSRILESVTVTSAAGTSTVNVLDRSPQRRTPIAHDPQVKP